MDQEIIATTWFQRIRNRTPARLLVGRAGASYRTGSQLELRQAHAAAVDAVRDELDLDRTLGQSFCSRWNLFEVATQANSKAEFLLRPDKGRKLSDQARQIIVDRCAPDPDIQILIGDGLSVSAVAAQVGSLLPLLYEGAKEHRWSVGHTFVVRHCRVGVLNDVGEILRPKVAILLIGERPGLATAESLSAYMAYRPRANHTDAERTLVSNIHSRGTPSQLAATRILDLASAMFVQQVSGTKLQSRGPNLGTVIF
jgi:ethanolamine ammonia-lyase small subunit